MRVISRKRSRLSDAALGAVSGLFASWVMERAQSRLARIGSEATRRREQAALSASGRPATEKVADTTARLLGLKLLNRQRRIGGEIVHYATGAVWGAVFGAFSRELAAPAVVAGAAYGALLWLVEDEALTALLGLSLRPDAYPASIHAKALTAHLVYGATTAGTYRLLSRVAA